jgi:hypothetical protein
MTVVPEVEQAASGSSMHTARTSAVSAFKKRFVFIFRVTFRFVRRPALARRRAEFIRRAA